MPRKHLLPKRAKVKRAGKKGEEGRSNPQHEQQGVPYNLPKQKSRRQPPCCCACLFGFAKNQSLQQKKSAERTADFFNLFWEEGTNFSVQNAPSKSLFVIVYLPLLFPASLVSFCSSSSGRLSPLIRIFIFRSSSSIKPGLSLINSLTVSRPCPSLPFL